MRKLCFSLLFLAWLPIAGWSQDGRAGIVETIQGQIEAFLSDDFAGAFDYASPMIRQIFRNSENFGAMVREGYPMVWRPAEVQFLELEDRNGQLVQNVLIRDSAGQFWALEYEMLPMASGWKINGVQVLKAPGAGV